MSYDLNSYFQLGMEAGTMPQNSLVMNTIRTPVDTQSGRSGLSKVTFKVPKVGLLTGDSMVTVQIIEKSNGMPTTSNVTPNFISGALGCVERCRILIDNKVLTDLEKPSLLEIPKMYSRSTENEVASFQNKFLANQFQTGVDPENGAEVFKDSQTRYFTSAVKNNDVQNVVRNRPSSEANSRVYGLHLKNLGAQFLETDSLPVFLLGSREMIIELFIHKDCREYLVPTQGTLAADDYEVNYPIVELVSTHIQIPDDVASNEIEAMARQPVAYPLIDNYLVKGFITNGAAGAKVDKVYRVNAQNREVHKLLIAHSNIKADVQNNNRVVGNQKAIALGDVSLQIKANGLNIYERPIISQSLLFQQSTYAHDGMALKLPMYSFRLDNRSLNNNLQSDETLYLNYRGNANYQAVDFANGNGGVFGGGTVMKQATEIEYSATPRAAANPIQENRTFDTNFYLSVSKMLTIGAKSVDISF